MRAHRDNRSVSTRRRPRSTFFTAEPRLSYLTSVNTPPNQPSASACPSKNACWVSTGEAMLNAAPEKHERMKNTCTRARAPARSTSASPQSTSAVRPGACTCGTNTSPTVSPSSRRRLRT